MVRRQKMENIRFSDDGRSVVIIDQTLLPRSETERRLTEPGEMFEAIASLRVRGAPAIGIFAAYCLSALAFGSEETETDRLLSQLRRQAEYLNSARPTAVNLSWALKRMTACADSAASGSLSELKKALRAEAEAIRAEDIAMCLAISENGLSLVRDGDGILTHCNAGPLATSKYGTALGPILLGRERGIGFRVFSDETRPLLQGARLTSFELYNAGVDVTLICDNMAASLMKKGLVQAVFVGCDRVANNGDAANKIGTLGVAVLAKHFGVPFYVLGPTSTIDVNCATGAEINIELRDPEEIKTKFYREPVAPEGVKCWNPAFDVTDAELITAIVTDKGIFYPPFDFSAVLEKGER